MSKTIIEKYYYIIKVVCDNGNKVYYKIGEANKRNRPESLVEKYRKLRSNEAEILLFEELPHDAEKRLNDKEIHKHLDSSLFKKADPIYIEHYLDEVDGKDEFCETLSNFDVVENVKTLVESLSNKKYYTANNTYDTTLEYKADQYHLVNVDLITKIIDTYDSINKELYHYINNTILLVGQFEPEFIASIAMFHNVYIWHDGAEQKHDYKFNRINNKITYIDKLGDLLNMNVDFDIVISNPPYGKIGAEITHNIIDNINYKEFVNLLPANDYHRGNDDLYKYADINTMESIRGGFADAVVTTHVAKINKKASSITEDEFEIENYIDDSLKKYFYENRKRSHYAIDLIPAAGQTLKNAGIWDVAKTYIIGYRDMNHAHLPYTKNCTTYKWNIEESIDMTYLIEHCNTRDNRFMISQCIFNTSKEKRNFVNFIYSVNGFRFCSKLFKAMNLDGLVKSIAFPKVDWTREWTVEEILADYGYNEAEIKEVMDDLVNFKGMDD